MRTHGKTAAVADIPIGQMAQPHEVAELVAFVLRPTQASLNGATLDVNGGSYAQSCAEGILAIGDLIEFLESGDFVSPSLVPTEALFTRLIEAGFTDELAVRTVATIATLCLGFSGDYHPKMVKNQMGRPESLQRALEQQEDRFVHLARISKLGIDTYSKEHLEFAITAVVRGVSTFAQ